MRREGLWLARALTVVFLLLAIAAAALACKGPMFSSTDEADIRAAIEQAVQDEEISEAKGQALLEVLDQLQQGTSWEAILASVLGIAGAFFGIKAQRRAIAVNAELAERPRTLPDPADVSTLREMLAKYRAAHNLPFPGGEQ